MNSSTYDRILSRFTRVLRRYYLLGILTAFGYASALLLGLMGVSALFEAVSYLKPPVKCILFYTSLIIPAVAFVSLALAAFVRRPGHIEIARLIERCYPQLGDRLISAVQLGRLDEESLAGQSSELVEALFERVDGETAGLVLERSVPSDRAVASMKTALGTLAVLLLLAAVVPGSLLGGLYRLSDYSRTYLAPDTARIYTLQGMSSIIRGSNFNSSGFYSGDTAEELSIYYRWITDDTWNVKPVALDGKNGAFTFTLENPRVSFHYYLETKRAVTPSYLIDVIERPDVEALEISLAYPAYTGLGSETRSDSDGNIRALRGTVVSLGVRANKMLSEMALVWGDSTTTSCRVNGENGTASFTVTGSMDYRFSLIDTLGIENINPITYRVTSLDDEVPLVTIVQPPSDITLPGSMKYPLVYRAGDDYGLSSIVLKFKLPFEEEHRAITLEEGTLGNEVEGQYVWNLSGMNLMADDTVSYQLIAYDNDIIGGPNRGVSEERFVRLPSMTEIFNEVMNEQEKSIEKLRNITERSRQQERTIDDISRSVKRGDEIEWSEKNTIKESEEHMKKMQEEVKELSESLAEMVEKLSSEHVVTLETLDKLETISQIMGELAEGEMKEALKQLITARAGQDPRELKKVLDQYKVTAEGIQKKLDRIINLLEQVKTIQRFEVAKGLLEDMAGAQAEMTQKYSQNTDDPALPREEEILAGEMGKLEGELKDVAAELKEKFKLNTMNLDATLASSTIAEFKHQASQHMAEGSGEQAMSSLDSSSAQLSELLLAMDAMEATMQAANTGEMQRRLFKALSQLLVVSEKQERFLGTLTTLKDEDLARGQLELVDALSKAERSLASLGEVLIELSGIVDQIMTSTRMTMEAAVGGFTTGDGRDGEKNARVALKMLNSNIHFLTLLVQQNAGMQGGAAGMPGDLMQQLQSIANGQLSVQQQLGDGAMERLAAEQQKLAEMLADLNQQILQDKRLREMLEKLAGDMDETATDMRRNEKRELIEHRQLDMYRRLLDAKRSRREKDETEERKSWTAKRNVSRGAEELSADLGEKERELNELTREALEDDFDPEYRSLIRRYFESLMLDARGLIR